MFENHALRFEQKKGNKYSCILFHTQLNETVASPLKYVITTAASFKLFLVRSYRYCLGLCYGWNFGILVSSNCQFFKIPESEPNILFFLPKINISPVKTQFLGHMLFLEYIHCCIISLCPFLLNTGFQALSLFVFRFYFLSLLRLYDNYYDSPVHVI